MIEDRFVEQVLQPGMVVAVQVAVMQHSVAGFTMHIQMLFQQDFSLGEDQAIKLRTETSSFALEKNITVDLRQTPYLEWEWKVTVPPTGGDFSSPDTDDQAAQLLIVFPRTFFERRKVISYIWDPTSPKGTTAAGAGPIHLNVQAIVVESGADQIGQWVIEKRNVVEDFRALFGEIPERAVAIRMQINSQHTKSVAEVFWRTIHFTSE